MIFLRSFLFNLCFYFWTFLICAVFLPGVFSRRVVGFVGRSWARVTFFLLRQICGITYQVKGREHIATTPVIYASKHQSAWDTMIFWITSPHPIYILKRELTWIPLFGWFLLGAGSICINRQDGRRALKTMIDDGKKVLAEGHAIIIFPEGTRTAPFTKQTYHSGVVALYNALGVPIVPVALNSGLFWGRKAFLKKPGVITIEFLPAIPPGGDKKQLMAILESRIEAATDKLLSAATSPDRP